MPSSSPIVVYLLLVLCLQLHASDGIDQLAHVLLRDLACHHTDLCLAFSLILSINLVPTIFSRCLHSIGLRSEEMSVGGLIFGTGQTFAFFHMSGTWPSHIDVLKMLHIGRDIYGIKSLRIQFGMLSRPGDLLTIVTDRCFSTSTIVIV